MAYRPMNVASRLRQLPIRVRRSGGSSTIDYAARWGLVSYWNLEDTADAYGSNTLTNNNSVTFTSGKVGNAATMVAASSQYLSLADNASLSIGDVDCWWTAWAKATTLGADRVIVGQYGSAPGNRAFVLRYRSASARFNFLAYPDGTNSTLLNADTFGAPSTGTWYFLCAYHDAVNNRIGISVNGGAFDTTALSGGIFDSSGVWTIGSEDGADDFWDGQIDAVAFGKSPPLGISALATEIRDTLYNGGDGRSWPF